MAQTQFVHHIADDRGKQFAPRQREEFFIV
jgi:hypothetical protein